MIGLIAQAVGMAANMASGFVKDNNVVEKTSTYTPTGFSSAGLFNNAIGDLGQVDTYTQSTEEKPLKRGLAGFGASNLAMSPMMDSMFGDVKFPKKKPKSGATVTMGDSVDEWNALGENSYDSYH